jgi:hypothetical protein
MHDLRDRASARNNFRSTADAITTVIPLRRPHIERECDGEGWYCILGDHGWLCGDRLQAISEFTELERIERSY